MKKEDIFNGITDIRGDLVEEAGKSRRRSSFWRGAVAACLALVLVAGTAWAVLGGRRAGSNPPPSQEQNMVAQPGESGTHVPPADEGPATSGSPAGVAVLAGAVCPQAVLYPADGLDTGAWSAYQNAHLLDKADAEALRDFLDAFVPAFLADAGDGNALCSPVNVFTALCGLAGASDGRTREQLLDLLGVPDIGALRALTHRLVANLYNDDGAEIVRLASALWLRRDGEYDTGALKTLAEDYFLSSYAGNPGTPEMDAALQNWLDARTGGLPEDGVGGVSLAPDTAAALVAAVSFSAKWERSFDGEKTAVRAFRAPGGTVEREFMSGVFPQYYPGEGFTGVELNFRVGGTMRLLLPDEGVSPGELLENPAALDFLISADLARWEGRRAEVSLSLPKFDVTDMTDLRAALRALGVTDAFDPAVSNLADLADGGGVYISDVLHAARVKVDEEGCEAAACTVAEFPGSAEPESKEKVSLLFDHPFLFSVMEEGAPVLTGIVNEP